MNNSLSIFRFALFASLSLPTFAETNAWIAADAGNASVAENWSLGRIPAATDDILVDGDLSIAALTWDVDGANGLPDTVASWTQTATYTNVVVLPTMRSGAFTKFTVSGDAVLSGGRWWREREPNLNGGSTKCQPTSWLWLVFGGDVDAGSSFTFDGKNAGYFKSRGLGGNSSNGGASHGGQGGSDLNAYATGSGYGICYGSYREPASHGTGGFNVNSACGGGTIVLEVAGTLALDGAIDATSNNDGIDGGAGGSVWIRANRLVGSGAICADGGGSNSSNNKGGAGGGRVAIHLLAPDATYATYTNDFTGTVTARGGTGLNAKKNQNFGAAGTVYVETPADHGKGRMFLVNRNRTLTNGSTLNGNNTYTVKGTAVVKNGVTCDLASLAMSADGRIGIEKGGTLRVPSFAAITGDGSTYCALRFDDGGTLVSDIPDERLAPAGYNLVAYGTNVFDRVIVLNAPATFDVAGEFTLPALKADGVFLPVGDHLASECGDRVTGTGILHITGMDGTTVLIIR